jgi:HsdM N-terminal domain
MSTASSSLVNKLWNYCNILRDDGLSYGDYVEQLTFLLFLKIAHERRRIPPYRVLHLRQSQFRIPHFALGRTTVICASSASKPQSRAHPLRYIRRRSCGVRLPVLPICAERMSQATEYHDKNPSPVHCQPQLNAFNNLKPNKYFTKL